MFVSVTDSRPAGRAFGGQEISGAVEARQRSKVAFTALLFAVVSIAIFVSQQVCAQTTTYASSDQTVDGMSMMPTPGGHDYEHLLSETVTFASGQLSYRLQYPMPKGRGISAPYWFGYSSAGLYRLYLNAPDNSLTWTGNNLSFNGASPVATWQVTETPSQTFQCGPPGSNPCQTWPCYVATGFTFYGPDGTNHNIGLYSFAPVGTPPPTGYYGQCAQPGSGVAAPGADGEVSAQFVSPSQEISSLQSGYVGQFTVTDKNGTTYFFGGGTSEGGVYVGVPTQIEDRNGNIINTGSNGFVDTLGRTVATGNNGIAQTIGGIAYPAPTPPAGAPSSVSVSYSVPNSTSTAPCFIKGGVNINTVSGSQPAWSGIALPDGTQYTLFSHPI